MRKMLNVGTVWLSCVVLGVAVWAVAGTPQQVGDNFTVILPEGKLTNLRKVLVVKAPKPSLAKVGDCKSGEVRMWEAELVDREGKEPPVPTEVAIIIPGAAGVSELKTGWRIGSWRSGGKCGPGYEAYLAHIIALQ